MPISMVQTQLSNNSILWTNSSSKCKGCSELMLLEQRTLSTKIFCMRRTQGRCLTTLLTGKHQLCSVCWKTSSPKQLSERLTILFYPLSSAQSTLDVAKSNGDFTVYHIIKIHCQLYLTLCRANDISTFLLRLWRTT